MIDLTIYEDRLARAVQRARERGIIIPTLAQQRDPTTIPEAIRRRLASIGLWDITPLNLFRITWKNEPVPTGGGFGAVNYLEFPASLTGVEARIIALVGKWFPTGAHKVGAAFGCLVPRLVTGQFDPTSQKAAWPSTGNYCRGGAYDSALLGCDSIAILPEGMSQERFEWLASVAGEVIKTPGTESNVKEIFDKCWELRSGDTYRGVVLTTGSAGTIGCGDYLKQVFPSSKIAASEALQCPTLLYNGFGAHRIEGIGDKHVPWIHNVKNTDMVMAIDDEATMQLIRLFNEPAGQAYLASQGVPEQTIASLPLLGISGVANLLSCIKFARYYELGNHDVVLTVLTDSMEMYASRLRELTAERGPFTREDAIVAYHRYLRGQGIEYMEELSYYGRKRIHNLKYYTWVEQQGKSAEELQAQWYDPNYWTDIQNQVEQIDALIKQFNERTGLLKTL